MARSNAKSTNDLAFKDTGALVKPIGDLDARWDLFDPHAYYEANYRTLLDADRAILVHLRDFMVTAGVTNGRGLDAGAGANIYPSLAMLPFCHRIDLCEHAQPNVTWLQREVLGYHESWDGFWNVLTDDPTYRDEQPREALATRAVVSRGSIFDLIPRQWDLGTMFFVACSISEDMSEFDRAIDHFVRALRPNAPFAIACMLGSSGYEVNGVHFPAVKLTMSDVRRSLRRLASELNVVEVESDPLVRPDYNGMALATGWTTVR